MSTPAPYAPPPQPGGVYQQQVNGTLILVLGIVSIFCVPILGPVAIILGKNAIRSIDTGVADPSQRGNAQAGMICGIVGSVVLVLGIISWIVYAIFFAAVIAKNPSMLTNPSSYSTTTGGTPGATTSGTPADNGNGTPGGNGNGMPGQGGNGMPGQGGNVPGGYPMNGPSNGNQGGNGMPGGAPPPSSGNVPGNANGAPY